MQKTAYEMRISDGSSYVCSSDLIVPQGAGPSSAGSSATPPRIDYNVPVRQPTPSTPIAPVAAATVAGATTAITAGLAAGPAVTALPLDRAQADSALAAFRISCPSLVQIGRAHV